MTKQLNKGDCCIPRDAEERQLVLDIASMLGIAYYYSTNWKHDSRTAIYRPQDYDGLILDCRNNNSNLNPLSVPDFIAGMYALAESRKTADEGSVKMNRGGIFKWNGKEWVDMYTEKWDKLHSLEVKSVLFDDILKRLTVLEEKKPLFVDMLSRIGKLETKTANDDVVRSAASHEGWSFAIDPKASPKNIPFEVALMYMKAGRKVRMKDWRSAYISIDSGVMMFHRGYDNHVERMCFVDAPLSGPMNSILATDWEVIPETK